MNGKIKVTYNGRAYPTPEQARQRLRKTLEILGVEIDSDDDIVAVMETPGAMCPWGAFAWVTQEAWDARKTS